MSKRRHDVEKPRILYMVNQKEDTSIPLEVADHFGSALDVVVGVYYHQPDVEDASFFNTPAVQLGVEGPLDLRGPTALYRLIKTYRPHVIHVHHTLSALWGSVLGRMTGVPVIVKTEHSSHANYGAHQNAANAVTLTLADAVLCNSDATRRSLHPWEQYLAAHKCKTVYNGIDVSRIKTAVAQSSLRRAELGAASGQFLLGSAGRLVWQKNYVRLIRALALARSEMPNIRLVIAGDGERRPALEREAARQGVTDEVLLLGTVPRQRVYELLGAIDAFVMPSLSEGFCNAVVEAMAAGKPIINADIDTFREVVGPAGALVDPYSPQDMAEAILRFARMEAAERERRGADARRRATQRFTVQRTAQRYTQQYVALLRQKGLRANERDCPRSTEDPFGKPLSPC